MASPQKKLLRHFARQNYQNCFHMQEKNTKSWLDVWKSLSDRFRGKVLTQLLPQSLHRAPGRTALPSTASDWLLISIFTPSFNSLKKNQIEGRHFQTSFPGIPQIFCNLFGTSSGGGFGVFSMLSFVQSHPRLERIVGLQPCPCGFPLLLTPLQITPKALLRAAHLINLQLFFVSFFFLAQIEFLAVPEWVEVLRASKKELCSCTGRQQEQQAEGTSLPCVSRQDKTWPGAGTQVHFLHCR